MIDHLGFAVADLSASRSFYERAFKPLGFSVLIEVTEEMTGGHGAHVGFGPAGGRPPFWIGTGRSGGQMHIAFCAETRAAVDAFYEAAIAAGAKDNGPPGLRPIYHPNYYGPFVFDPDGHNIEAVCHKA